MTAALAFIYKKTPLPNQIIRKVLATFQGIFPSTTIIIITAVAIITTALHLELVNIGEDRGQENQVSGFLEHDKYFGQEYFHLGREFSVLSPLDSPRHVV
jgi:hypothetical protein